MKRAIINFSTFQYKNGRKRLFESVRKYDVSVLMFEPGMVSVPPHSDVPYGFKLHAIKRARSMGFQQVLWLDASVYAVKDPEPVFDWLTRKDIFLEGSGHQVGDWCNDRTLDYFDITRDQAMNMEMFAGGYVGLDFTKQLSRVFFQAWWNAMEDGQFAGSWSDHRHDMTCGSIIAHKMALERLYSPRGQFFGYIGPEYDAPQESTVFHLQGIV